MVHLVTRCSGREIYNKINVVNSNVHTTVVLQPMDVGVIANVKSRYLRSTARVIVLKDREKRKPQTSWKGLTILAAIENICHFYAEINIVPRSLIASPALFRDTDSVTSTSSHEPFSPGVSGATVAAT